MRSFNIPLYLLILSFVFPDYTSAKQVSGFDIITMKNGDIHNGTVARERFRLTTPYGQVSIPYGFMATLTMGEAGNPDRLVSRSGDTFIGQIQDDEIRILRVLDTMLPLYTNDIAEITFAHRQLRYASQPVPDAVETQNGDRFLAKILGGDLP